MGTARTRRGPRGGEEGDTEPGPPGINPPSVLPCEIGHPQIQGWQSSGTPAGGSGEGEKSGPWTPPCPPRHSRSHGRPWPRWNARRSPGDPGRRSTDPKKRWRTGRGAPGETRTPPNPNPDFQPCSPRTEPHSCPPPSAGASRLPALFSLETVARAGAQIPGTLHQCEHPGLGWPGGVPCPCPPRPGLRQRLFLGVPPGLGGAGRVPA